MEFWGCEQWGANVWVPGQDRIRSRIPKEPGHNFMAVIDDEFLKNCSLNEFKEWCITAVKEVIAKQQSFSAKGTEVTRDGVRVKKERPTKFSLTCPESNQPILNIERDLKDGEAVASAAFVAKVMGVSRQTASRWSLGARKKRLEIARYEERKLYDFPDQGVADAINELPLPPHMKGKAFVRRKLDKGVFYKFPCAYTTSVVVKRKGKKYTYSMSNTLLNNSF